MDDPVITFVPKSKRGNHPLTKTKKQDKPKKVIAKKDIPAQQRKIIYDHYTGEAPKTFRNITFAHSMRWNKKEDTLYDFKDTKEVIYKPSSRKWENEDDDFERPSSRPFSKRNFFPEARQSRLWRAENQVHLSSRKRVDVPPLTEWGGCYSNGNSVLPRELAALLREYYDHPLPVQAQCIPLVLANHDIIGISQTGSGKTLAYAIPIIATAINTLNDRNSGYDPTAGPIGLILVPSHELAEQVEKVIRPFCEPIGIKTESIVGGMSITDQAISLSHGSHIIVATPGRLNDLLERQFLVISHCIIVALDEADKMVDKSLAPQIASIISQTAENRRLVMFSATMPAAVLSIVDKFFEQNVVTVRVGDIHDASEKIRQVIYYVSAKQKRGMLDEMLHGMKAPIIIFTNSKDSAEELANFLGYKGFRIATIHSGKSQKDREAVINAVIDELIDVVVSTDVMARGIDIEKVENVINYEMPTDITVYIHRIGRTGRGEQLGVATSFVTPEDTEIMYDLVKHLKRNNFHIPDGLMNNPASKKRPDDDQIAQFIQEEQEPDSDEP